MKNFQIPLNGSNFISEQRKEAFQQALEDGHEIQALPGNENYPEDQNGSSPSRDRSASSTATIQPAPTNGKHRAANPSAEQVAHGVSHFIMHQNRTLDIHQQYLQQQHEYAEIFQTLLDQQAGVLVNGAGEHSREIVENLQRSLDGFHRVQEKELEVHQEFLQHQAEYSKAFVELLVFQHRSLGNGTVPSASKTTEPAQAGKMTVSPRSIDQPAAGGSLHQAEPAPSQETSIKDIQTEPKAAPGPGSLPLEQLASTLLDIVAEKTGYPVEMLELSMDMEADLGIDSIKRVEILGSLEEAHPDLPPADTQVLADTRTLQDIINYMKSADRSSEEFVSRSGSTPQLPSEAAEAESSPLPEMQEVIGLASAQEEGLDQILLNLVAEKTGYPVDMLELSMDMEADLGIDSIKRVEILGAMEEHVPNLPAVEADTLGELRTLQEILTLMNDRKTKEHPPAPPHLAEGKKKFDLDGLTPTSVNLLDLSRPDQLTYSIDPDHPLFVTDEGSDLTLIVILALQQAGWPVLLLQPPAPLLRENNREFPESLLRISLPSLDPEDIGKELSQVLSKHEEIAGLIHLHPGSMLPDRDRALVKMVFFLAKYLGKELKQTDPEFRKLFLTVTQIDGALGLKNQVAFQESSGFSGLIKTLHWEWPQVFCRAIDIAPGLSAAQKATLLMEEIQDPQRGLQEVGLSAKARITPSTGQG